MGLGEPHIVSSAGFRGCTSKVSVIFVLVSNTLLV